MEAITAKFHCRWLIHADIPRVVSIASYNDPEYAWNEADFVAKINTTIMDVVTERDGKIVGFMTRLAKDRHKGKIHWISNFSIHPDYRRAGAGTALLCYTKNRMRTSRCLSLKTLVHESNLAMQMFLKSCGFLCTRIDRYDEGVYYLMRCAIRDPR